MKIYFETEKECDEFKATQKCRVRKFYNKLTDSYYLILSRSINWYGGEIKPDLFLLLTSQQIYSDYCNIVNEIERLSHSKIISRYEREELPKLLNKFNKFRDHTRNSYDTFK